MKHITATLLLALLSPLLCFAQLVKNERLLLFKNPHVPDFIILEIDTACPLTLDTKNIMLPIYNPDLALYREAADEVYDADGKPNKLQLHVPDLMLSTPDIMPTLLSLVGLGQQIT